LLLLPDYLYLWSFKLGNCSSDLYLDKYTFGEHQQIWEHLPNTALRLEFRNRKNCTMVGNSFIILSFLI